MEKVKQKGIQKHLDFILWKNFTDKLGNPVKPVIKIIKHEEVRSEKTTNWIELKLENGQKIKYNLKVEVDG